MPRQQRHQRYRRRSRQTQRAKRYPETDKYLVIVKLIEAQRDCSRAYKRREESKEHFETYQRALFHYKSVKWFLNKILGVRLDRSG